MKKYVFVCICMLLSIHVFSQTNNAKWNNFKSERLGFSIDYPDMWNISEGVSNTYVFNNTVKPYGYFSIEINSDFMDSVEGRAFLTQQAKDIRGAKLNDTAYYFSVIYKTTVLQNGKNFENHYWLFSFDNRIYTCRYSVEVALQQNPAVQQEFKSAYAMIETLHFF